jgi:hypothetical protein
MQSDNQKKILAIGIPLLLAAGAAITHSIAIHRAVQTGSFLVLKTNMREGAVIEDESLIEVQLPERYIPKGAVRSENRSAMVKTKTRRSLQAGKLLFDEDLALSLDKLEPDQNHIPISIFINRQWVSTDDLDVGDHILILTSGLEQTSEASDYTELGPYQILRIFPRESDEIRTQRVLLAVPKNGLKTVDEITGSEPKRRIVEIKKQSSSERLP